MSGIDLGRPAFLDDEMLLMFENSVNQLLAENAGPKQTALWRSDGIVPRSIWKAAGDLGILGASIPEAYGGSGGDFRFDAILIEQLGRHNALNLAFPLHSAVVAPYILQYGTEEQKLRFLPGVCSGETILAIAMTEPASGSDLQGMKSKAVRNGDHYIINGQKTFISNGHLADIVIVAAKTDPDAGSKSISLFVVDTASTKGFSRGPILEKLGQEGRDTAEMFFADMIVPADCLLGTEGNGLAMLMSNLPQERLVIAWQAMAMMESALEQTIAYVKDRKLFNRKLIEFQNSQFKLAECKMQATVAKVFLHHCTEKLLAGQLDAATASMAKLWITEAQARVIDECLQLHGGYGYMAEYPISQMYKDARGYRIYGGTSEIMKLLIARSL
ncbi:acyl-CoA dehydrogenase family protein [Sphingorhabdus sp.]|uniref:acyl-CoA dehydrogenase family protein n=1 Tax=Sphingorhabdus sp. TaxID=1902408 RepID=UPI0037CBE91E